MSVPDAASATAASPDGFAASRKAFTGIVDWLDGPSSAGMDHAALEDALDAIGRDLLRALLQDHLDLRAAREQQIVVTGADGAERTRIETGHARCLATVFGPVTVTRMAYRAPGRENLHPADAALNLPREKHSHGLRRLAATEAARGSFDATVDAVTRATGQDVGKRQVENLVARAAVDFDAFYASHTPPGVPAGDVLVLSCDGKGVVMRPDALRPATAKAAAATAPKLATRLSKGEKRGRKRMAEVGAVYAITPAPRHPRDILPGTDAERLAAQPGPTARDKWLTASVEHDAATVVTAVFDEADRRDRDHARTWVALVDGNTHQITRIHAEATARRIAVPVVIDFVHVLEYLWKAAWSFHAEGDPNAEAWVRRHAVTILDGRPGRVAGALRRAAARAGLDRAARANADRCADYLTNKKPYLDYPTALRNGWPIATGIIEGACRHLVKDRMDITGARWGLPGAEAVLKLRALHCNNDFHAYWHYHLDQERHRIHTSRYAHDTEPRAA